MYTGGNQFFRTRHRIRRVPSQRRHGSPVESAQAEHLPDDHLKVNNQFNNSSLGSQVNHQGS